MLKEAFQYLVETGKATANPIMKADAEPPHVYYLRTGDKVERVTAVPKPAMAAAYSLQAIVAKARDYAPNAEVWYSAGAVIVDYGEDFRNFATLELAFSDPLNVLAGWKKHKPALSQAELVRELRVTFRDCLAQAGELVECLRRVRFNSTSAIEGEVGHGKASLGKAITGEVTGLKAIPEYVTFNLPVYANPCFRAIRAAVECAFDPDAGTGTFRVIPLPGQLEGAVDLAMNAIAEQLQEKLSDAEVPVFYGKP